MIYARIKQTKRVAVAMKLLPQFPDQHLINPRFFSVLIVAQLSLVPILHDGHSLCDVIQKPGYKYNCLGVQPLAEPLLIGSAPMPEVPIVIHRQARSELQVQRPKVAQVISELNRLGSSFRSNVSGDGGSASSFEICSRRMVPAAFDRFIFRYQSDPAVS